jgi:hypothetical protein
MGACTYSHSDFLKSSAFEVIKSKLGFKPKKRDLYYNLYLSDGECGTYNELSVTCPISEELFIVVKSKYNLKEFDAYCQNEQWKSDLYLLTGNENASLPLLIGISNFLNSKKFKFQDEVNSNSKVYFSNFSDVNSWAAFWFTDNKLNYLSFEQG